MALGKWYDAQFVKIEKITKLTWKFWVEIPSIEAFNFVPGQFVTFDLPIHEKRNRRWRSYSIASAPNGGNLLEFVIVLLEGGAGTTYLFNEVKEGTPLRLRGPLGKFTLPKTLDLTQEICFVCTGTGIAPFRSMLLNIRDKNLPYPKMRLIFGTRYLENVLYYEEMKALTNQLEGFEYEVTLSRENSANWTGRKGYVHPVYEELYTGKLDVVFYLCGWDVMINEARKRLAEMGYKRPQIRFESYG